MWVDLLADSKSIQHTPYHLGARNTLWPISLPQIIDMGQKPPGDLLWVNKAICLTVWLARARSQPGDSELQPQPLAGNSFSRIDPQSSPANGHGPNLHDAPPGSRLFEVLFALVLSASRYCAFFLRCIPWLLILHNRPDCFALGNLEISPMAARIVNADR